MKAASFRKTTFKNSSHSPARQTSTPRCTALQDERHLARVTAGFNSLIMAVDPVNKI